MVTFVVFVNPVIFAYPPCKKTNLPTSVDANPAPPFIPVVAEAANDTPVPTAVCPGFKVVVVVLGSCIGPLVKSICVKVQFI